MIEIIDVRDANDFKTDEDSQEKAREILANAAEKVTNEKPSFNKDIHNAVMSALTFRRG